MDHIICTSAEAQYSSFLHGTEKENRMKPTERGMSVAQHIMRTVTRSDTRGIASEPEPHRTQALSQLVNRLTILGLNCIGF